MNIRKTVVAELAKLDVNCLQIVHHDESSKIVAALPLKRLPPLLVDVSVFEDRLEAKAVVGNLPDDDQGDILETLDLCNRKTLFTTFYLTKNNQLVASLTAPMPETSVDIPHFVKLIFGELMSELERTLPVLISEMTGLYEALIDSILDHLDDETDAETEDDAKPAEASDAASEPPIEEFAGRKTYFNH